MFEIIKRAADLYSVGYFDPTGRWFHEGNYPTLEDAERQVTALNGGGAPKKSTKPDTGGAAYPEMCDGGYSRSGMTLRDYFAAAALTGLLASSSTDSLDYKRLAALSYEYADAMLAARKS